MRHKFFVVFVQILALFIPCLSIIGHRTALEPRGGSTGASAQPLTEQAQAEVSTRNPAALNGAGFEENLGQSDAQAQYITKSGGATAFLTGHSAVFALPVPDDKGERLEPQQKLQPKGGLPDEEIPISEYQAIQLEFVGANQSVKLFGEDPLSGVYNYFIGSDSSKWATGVRRFARVRGKEIYPGIDIVYYFNEGEMEYDFVVRAGADASLIQLHFDWADKVSLTANGDLTVEKGKAKLTQRAPVVYQVNDSGERLETPSRYQHDKDGRIRIELGDYDRNQELVIDPRVVMGTFLGGSDWDYSRGIDIGSDGAIYVTGYTNSSNFPLQNPYQSFKYNTDIFVTKLTADGTALVYSTFFGGSGSDGAAGIAVGTDGSAYITGYTWSSNLPTTSTAPQPNFPASGGVHAYVTKFAPSGAALSYSSFIAGTAIDPLTTASVPGDVGKAVALLADGSAIVVGYTYCSDFPTTPGAFQLDQLGTDAFVTKINPAGTVFTFSTYLGAGGTAANWSDLGHAVVAYPDGSVCVAGSSDSPNFPTTPGAFSNTSQSTEAFVTHLNVSGTGLVSSTLIGGASLDEARAVAVDSSGNAYITGVTHSFDYPTTPTALQPIYPGGGGGAKGFVTKVAADGSALLYSTYLGGSSFSSNTEAFDIGVKSNGNFVAVGYTTSTDFPLLQSCYPRSGWSDAFVAEFQSNGTPVSCILVGGSGEEYAYGVAFDSSGQVCITGDGNSADFPTSPGAFQPVYTGTNPWPLDAFVAVIGAGSCTCTLEYSGANYTVAENVAGGNVTITINRTGGCGDPVTVDYITIANTATAASDYTTKTGTLSFASGEMSKTFDVTILNNTVDETTESFLLQLSNPGAGHVLGQMRTSVVTIEDDDVAGAFEFSNALYTTNENGGALTITVNRIGGSAGAVTVRYSTSNATATSGADFTALSNVTLSFAHGQASKTFTVAILNDALVEGAEPFNLTLSTPSGRSTLGKQSKAVVYVLDDEIQ